MFCTLKHKKRLDDNIKAPRFISDEIKLIPLFEY